ncbi:MAG: hypothetical protein MUO24_08820 [Desulfobacterales bacterium]|nr:hypothetical protein [Desulfobacterales bacterium]
MKRTILIFLSLVISALIIALPYKKSVEIFAGATYHVAIYAQIVALFKLGLWTRVAFLFVLLPIFLLIQIRQPTLRVYKKVLFIVEGIIALSAALVMYVSMSFNFFEQDMILTPIFYLALSWVIVWGLAAILLAKKKIYEKAANFLNS